MSTLITSLPRPIRITLFKVDGAIHNTIAPDTADIKQLHILQWPRTYDVKPLL